jgi:peptidoglycan/LPS O-acetylase OafA/YrhL
VTIYNIQVLRAFAAVSIVIVHTLLGIHSYGFQSLNKFNLDDFGVDIFFVISGFIMVFIQNNYKRNSIDFFIQRVKRILPIYWICNFIILLLFLLFPAIFNTLKINFDHFFLSLFFLSQYIFLDKPIIIAGWTLEYEMLFYFLFAIFINIKNIKFSYFFIFITITILCFTGLINLIFIEFLFGMLIGIIYINSSKVKIFFLHNYCYYFLIFGFIILFLPIFNSLELNRLIKYGLPSTLIVLGSIYAKQITNKYAILIGNASYSIYLAQGFCIPAILKFFKIFFPEFNVVIIFFILLIGSVLFGLFIYYFIERNLSLLIKKL